MGRFLGLLAMAAGLPTCIAFFCFITMGVVANDLSLPPLKPHPLPPSLALKAAKTDVGDYFSALETIPPVNYLIWSEFPIKVYIERPAESDNIAPTTQRFYQWVEAVKLGVEEWNVYLPLQVVEEKEEADILILQEYPPLKPKLNRATGLFDLPRAAAAQTRYQFYLKPTTPPILAHRITIIITPGQSDGAILAAARHELGHGLGIWGHSLEPTDALYFSQVAQEHPISLRDINTLKKVYEQPTRLGWIVPELK